MKAKTRFLVEAKKHLGVNGRPNQFTRWYAKEVAKDDNFLRAPWCDMFVSYVAHTVGLSREVGRYAYCPYHVDWFKKNKQWGSTPRVGAIAFMDWDGDGRADHVGIVESFNGNTVVTIEGNKGNAVQRVVRTNGIMGYGYPRYPGDSVPKTHTVQRGDSLSGIALHYYSDYSRWRDIYKTNRKLIGNDPALIKPGMRLTLPKA
jgi:nucleoid-associated protein YgaU